MDFLKWYKHKVEANDLDPPVNTWDNIQDELDIDHSWQQIRNRLDTRDRFAVRLRISAAASLLLLAMAGATWIYLSSADKVKTRSEMAAADLTGESGLTENASPQGGITDKEDAPDKLAADKYPVIIDNTEEAGVLLAGLERDLKEQAVDDMRIMEAMSRTQEAAPEKKSVENPHLMLRSDYHSFLEPVDPVSLPGDGRGREKKAFRKFYVGSRGQLANTWLVNQKTISGFKSASLVSTNATFGSNFGFYAGTNLFRKLDLQAEFNILAQNNQDYNEYLNGQYINSKLKLDYSQMAVSLRYNINSYSFMEGEHGINFGGYLAYLHNAYQDIDGQIKYLSDSYNNIDYGLIVGYEYIFPLYGHLGLGTGLRAYYGLNNIYSGDGYIPSYMNVTNNASVNITLSLKYVLK